MSEPDITALARRLAEQNNVEWRALHGSGDGGRIVERDVLDYLARVMAGEEALDPTPEPLPEGMEAWPDQDPAMRAAGEPTTLGELRQEIGSAVRDESDAASAVEDGVRDAATEVDEDVFLFDDEPAPLTEAQQPVTPGLDQVEVATSDDLEDLLVAGDDAGLLGDDDVGATADVFGAQPAPVDDDALAPPTADEPAAAPAADWGSDIAFGGSDAVEDQDAPDIWGEPVATAGDDVDLFAGSVQGDAESVIWAEEGHGGDVDHAKAEPWTAPVTGQGPEAEADTWSQAAVNDPEVVSELGEQEAFAGLPLARTGTVLRRHVDVTALAGAQLAVSQELGFEEPLGAGPFVLRAVAKAARDQGVGLGQVALATFSNGLRLRRVDDAAGRPFAQLLNELTDDGQEEDEAGLVVADLSSLDVDEVVLDVELPVVSLGRMLYDNQRGGYRSTLTLTGDLPAEQGARLLGRVAELLDAPVRLVM